MLHFQYDIACCILVLFSAWNPVRGDIQNVLSLQQRAAHLPDTKFGFNEYSEYSDTDDRDKGSLGSQWNQEPILNHNGRTPKITHGALTHLSEAFDKNIVWDSNWAHNLEFGQISAVSIDPKGNIVIFHRGSRIWGISTFNNENRFDPRNGPVKENTIVVLDKTGRKLFQWGRNMFYLPHGLTVDHFGNYWITDVAMHQVFKFDAQDIESHMADLNKQQFNEEIPYMDSHDTNDLFQNSILKPTLILGEAFEPGNDERRFCKPTAVAVQKNGDFFVSDGYCNSRIVKFNAKGERILQWGRHWGIGGNAYSQQPPPPNAFFVPHALALANELNYVLVADRENGRVLCFFASNGTFHKEYRHPAIGTKIYSVAYAREKLYLINGPDPYANSDNEIHVRGFVLDFNTGNILSEFGPRNDMDRPHDLAVTENGSEIYVVELDLHKIYRFVQDVNASMQTDNSITRANSRHEPAPLTDSSSNASTGGTTTAILILTLVTAAVIFIALCVSIAAIVARYQKRGRLFQYDESAVEFSKLVE